MNLSDTLSFGDVQSTIKYLRDQNMRVHDVKFLLKVLKTMKISKVHQLDGRWKK
jgi:hypothetical protein